MNRHPLRPLDGALLMNIHDRLLGHFGPQNWWPGDSPLEVMVGALLTQNTAWSNAKRAIRALVDAQVLSLQSLATIPEARLAELIRPCGYYRIKARRLKNLITALEEFCQWGEVDLTTRPTRWLRKRLLAVSGVGPETADSILLYAAEKPVFVVDAYTKRALSRHRWIIHDMSYDEVQSLFLEHLTLDVALFNEFHALLVALGKNYCRPKPCCSGCPLEDLLEPSFPARNDKNA